MALRIIKILRKQFSKRSLFDVSDPKFDQDLYAILNPDVIKFSADILAHWKVYGEKENRIGRKNSFSLESIHPILNNDDLYKFPQLQNLLSPDIAIKEAYSVGVPWTLGCWGRPSEIFVIKIVTYKPIFMLKRKIYADAVFIKRISPKHVRLYLRESLTP
jgi:hypothetical protein